MRVIPICKAEAKTVRVRNAYEDVDEDPFQGCPR